MDARLAQEFFKLRKDIVRVLDEYEIDESYDIADELLVKFNINPVKE